MHLLFFCLETPEHAVLRVAQRVKVGGHNVPEEIIRRRFKLGISNLVNLFIPICDTVHVWNNTKGEAILVAKQTAGTENLEIVDLNTWNKLLQVI